MATLQAGDPETYERELANILHEAHAQNKLKQLFASRKSLFRRRVKPAESDEENEDGDSIEESIREAVKFVPHAAPVNLQQETIPLMITSGSESLIWSAAPEIIFILVCIFDVAFSVYIMVAGMTGVSFKSSIDSIVQEPAELPMTETVRKYIHNILNQNKNYKMVTFDINIHGPLQLTCGAMLVINSIFGCKVILRGIKKALIAHVAVGSLLLISLAISGYDIMKNGKCDPQQFNTRFLEHFVNKYTIGTDSKLKIDAIQRSIGCCGNQEGWFDYLNSTFIPKEFESFTTKREDLAGELVVYPSSCCNSWWIRNLQCASQLHNWNHTTTRDKHFIDRRLSNKGCPEQVLALCKNVIKIMGQGVLIITAILFLLFVITVICVILQIRGINSIINENMLKTQQAEDLCMGIFDDESDVSLNDSDEEINIEHKRIENPQIHIKDADELPKH